MRFTERIRATLIIAGDSTHNPTMNTHPYHLLSVLCWAYCAYCQSVLCSVQMVNLWNRFLMERKEATAHKMILRSNSTSVHHPSSFWYCVHLYSYFIFRIFYFTITAFPRENMSKKCRTTSTTISLFRAAITKLHSNWHQEPAEPTNHTWCCLKMNLFALLEAEKKKPKSKLPPENSHQSTVTTSGC